MQFGIGEHVVYKRKTYVILGHCKIKFNSLWSPGYVYRSDEGEIYVRYQGDFEDKFKKELRHGKESHPLQPPSP